MFSTDSRFNSKDHNTRSTLGLEHLGFGQCDFQWRVH